MQFVVAILFGIGLFFILCDVLRVPFMKTSKAANNLLKQQKKKHGVLEIWLNDLAVWLSKQIRLNEYKRIQMVTDLQSADMNISPELHVAKAIVKSVPVCFLVIPTLYIFPLLSPLVAAISFTMYLREVKGIQEKIKKKRDAINFELPRLVYTIDKTLEHNRDVLSMLENFKDSASPELNSELAVTVADMRAGNYESALTRLETRVGSSMMSDVTRGLIGVLRGDETALYWQALTVKFADIQRQLLKQQAQKVPGKVKKLSMCLLMCFMMTFLVVITVEIIRSLGAVLGGG